MKRFLVYLLLLVVMALFGVRQDVRAASLFGKVIDVTDGDAITVFNLNRPVKVKLMGIDAPEPGQPFAELAKQHLKNLVSNKLVSVEYSGLGQNGSVLGRVTLDGSDICAQMIRDGAAWFDIKNNSRLSEMDREIYRQSEAAARSERRGIWQSESAMAPWEFTALQARRLGETQNRTRAPKQPIRSNIELTPEQVLGSDYVIAGDRSDMAWAAPIARQWRLFEPAGQNFSVIVPAGGRKSVEITSFRDKPINTYAYMVHELTTNYAVIWMVAPYLGEIDEVAIPSILAGILQGFDKGFEKAGFQFRCKAKPPRTVAVKGYTARDFDLSGCHKPGVIRVYTRVVGEERQFVLGLAFFDETDPSVSRFLKSFTFKD